MNNWIGDTYRSEPHIRNWRNYFFWDKYNESQYDSISKLCESLCEKHKIEKKSMPSHALNNGVSKFNGIVYKSNYSDIYTDINPSFDFTIFFKNG